MEAKGRHVRSVRPPALVATALVAAVAVLVASSSAPVLAQDAQDRELAISGQVEGSITVRLSDGSVASEAASYELSLERELQWAEGGALGKLHLSVQGERDFAARKGCLLELDEAYADLYIGSADLRIGQQVVSWGTAYGVNPTSYVNPVPAADWTDLSRLADIESRKGLPVPAVAATAYPSWGEAALVLVLDPRLQGVPLPGYAQAAVLQGVALQIGGLTGLPAELAATSFAAEAPASTTDRLEAAASVGGQLGGWDVYLSGFRGWEDDPALWVEAAPQFGPGGVPVSMRVIPRASYRRVTAVGVAASGTVGPCALWAEARYSWPDALSSLDAAGNVAFSSNDPYAQVIVGADRSLGSPDGLYVMAQYLYNSDRSLLTPYQLSPNDDPGSRHYLIGMARYAWRDGHELEAGGIHSLDDGSVVGLSRFTYKLNANLSAWVALTLPHGVEGTEFGDLVTQGRTVSAGMTFAF